MATRSPLRPISSRLLIPAGLPLGSTIAWLVKHRSVKYCIFQALRKFLGRWRTRPAKTSVSPVSSRRDLPRALAKAPMYHAHTVFGHIDILRGFHCFGKPSTGPDMQHRSVGSLPKATADLSERSANLCSPYRTPYLWTQKKTPVWGNALQNP